MLKARKKKMKVFVDQFFLEISGMWVEALWFKPQVSRVQTCFYRFMQDLINRIYPV